MNVLDTVPSLALVIAIGVSFAAGVYLLLERSLSRVLLGFILLGNGANLLLLVAGGRAGGAPIVGDTPVARMSDPLVQAMVLTSIVITLGLAAFILAMAYRSWQLHGHDEVQDDVEDRRVAHHAARNDPAYLDADSGEAGQSLGEEAAEARDETVGEDEDGRGSGEREPGQPSAPRSSARSLRSGLRSPPDPSTARRTFPSAPPSSEEGGGKQ